jgi:hypothetical protein
MKKILVSLTFFLVFITNNYLFFNENISTFEQTSATSNTITIKNENILNRIPSKAQEDTAKQLESDMPSIPQLVQDYSSNEIKKTNSIQQNDPTIPSEQAEAERAYATATTTQRHLPILDDPTIPLELAEVEQIYATATTTQRHLSILDDPTIPLELAEAERTYEATAKSNSEF